jgi:hypothetical protein
MMQQEAAVNLRGVLVMCLRDLWHGKLRQVNAGTLPLGKAWKTASDEKKGMRMAEKPKT